MPISNFFNNKPAKQLESLNNKIFSCFLEPDYPQNEYLYERRLHMQKNKCIKKIRNTHSFYEKLFIIMLDYAQLRQRVSDHHTFSLCRVELIAIQQAINHLLQSPAKLNYIETFEEKINRFEDIYQNVLRVTAPDPLVFMLFIDSLRQFGQSARER